MPKSAERVHVQVEALAWLGLALGHDGHGRQALERTVPLGTSLIDLLDALAREHPEFARYALGAEGSLSFAHICVTLNGSVMASSQELATTLHDGDKVVILPAFSGG